MATPISDKPLEAISEADLFELVTAGVPEGRRIEYKSELPGGNDDAKREFLADVSSFANSSGGDIIYGIHESGGVPTVISGIPNVDHDSELRRLEATIASGIEPRLPGLRLVWVRLSSGTAVLIVRIPRSWAMPHLVSFKNYSRFYARNSAGKYQLDVQELRSLFALSSGVEERIRQFRLGRLSRIVAGEAAFALGETAILVLHLLPFASFVDPDLYDLEANRNQTSLAPFWAHAWSHRYNFDGFSTFAQAGEEGCTGYVQVFRNGTVESADASILFPRQNQRLIYGGLLEAEVIEKMGSYIGFQRELGVQPPIVAALSLLRVRDYRLGSDKLLYIPGSERVVDRDDLIVPEILINDLNSNPAELLKPAFDAIWNAAGWSGSRNYHNGQWIKPR